MNTQTRNEIALWLFDRVAQGQREEVGSMDWNDFQIDGQTARVTIMRDSDNEFLVWMDEYPSPDFTVMSDTTEELIKAALDLWHDTVCS